MSADESQQNRPSQERSTHFRFEHSVFRTPDPRFIIASDGEPSLVVELADLAAVIPIKSLRQEFELDKGPDGAMLDKVAAGLKFVKTIRPGDSIPREILDGTASWAVDDRHLEIAKGRITLQISSWLTGAETVIVDQEALMQLAEDPAVKQRVNNAFSDIALKLDLPPDRKEEVVDRIDQLARELSYIEALRERFGTIKAIGETVAAFQKIYRRDRTVIEDLSRITNLMRRPFTELQSIFDQVDGMSGEIISLLRNITRQIEFIRESRDELHQRMMLWDDIIVKFQTVQVDRTPENEALMKELYRFLARNFIVEKPWELVSAAFARQGDKGSGEKS
ncbi:hypothetical protein GCM10011611_52160 [Aliidongia dinghuensis]|uniref:Uncharacterized protein n=1 Tax=Aliidongia dinghuensis TaxID=1867774 RepID=A0A8J3E5X2_9PROT|nr:hypothetical protein [Aliidongia dinghuensis]GGF39331.1 hypothetical protein GCM10011611_52160 [Aliidongia dinghuensis]